MTEGSEFIHVGLIPVDQIIVSNPLIRIGSRPPDSSAR
jgi:hypothetical protein